MELYSSSNMLILYMWRPGEWVPSTQDVLRLCGSKPADRGPTCASCHPMWSHPQSYPQTNSKNIDGGGVSQTPYQNDGIGKAWKIRSCQVKEIIRWGFVTRNQLLLQYFWGETIGWNKNHVFFHLKWSSSGRKNNGLKRWSWKVWPGFWCTSGLPERFFLWG